MDAQANLSEVRFFVYGLFQNIDQTPAVRDQMEEMIADLTTKTLDLMNAGGSKEAALEQVFTSLGNTQELLKEFQFADSRSAGFRESSRYDSSKNETFSSWTEGFQNGRTRVERRKSLRSWLVVLLIASVCGSMIGCLGSFFEYLLTLENTSHEAKSQSISNMSMIMLVLSSPFFTVNAIAYCFFTFRLWKEVPRDIARTTPGRAVGLSFIPFFQLYWWFVAWFGLAEDMNRTAQRLGHSAKLLNSDWIFAACVFWVVSFCFCFLTGLISHTVRLPIIPLTVLAFSFVGIAIEIAVYLYINNRMSALIEMKSES